jgi:hypothetical protein
MLAYQKPLILSLVLLAFVLAVAGCAGGGEVVEEDDVSVGRERERGIVDIVEREIGF